MGSAGMDYGQTVPDGYPESSLPWQERQRHASGLAAMLKTIRVVLFLPYAAVACLLGRKRLRMADVTDRERRIVALLALCVLLANWAYVIARG